MELVMLLLLLLLLLLLQSYNDNVMQLVLLFSSFFFSIAIAIAILAKNIQKSKAFYILLTPAAYLLQSKKAMYGKYLLLG